MNRIAVSVSAVLLVAVVGIAVLTKSPPPTPAGPSPTPSVKNSVPIPSRCRCAGPAQILPQPSVTSRAPRSIGSLKPGSYCWEWMGGAFQYANDPCWVVSAEAPGYRILTPRGSQVSSMTGGSLCPSTQAAAEAAFPAHAEYFTWEGGEASIVLDDPNYAGNAEGSPSPSFLLCPVP